MNWNSSETLALAQQSCSSCYGLGMRSGRSQEVPCNCVFRAIFRACHVKFRQCASKEKYMSRVSLEANPGGTRRITFGLKNEEYIADFCLVSKRVLGEDTLAYRLFKFHYLLGADYLLCCPKLGLNRGEFFHEAYRIEQKLGRAFRELKPHALFPIDEYFGGTDRQGVVATEFGSEADTEEPPAKKYRFPLKGDA
jgi:hypothetical protein